MIELTLKLKSTGEERRYALINCSYSISQSEIRVSVSMYQAVDVFILSWLKREFQKAEKQPSFSASFDKQQGPETDMEASLVFTTPQNVTVRTIALKNICMQSYFSESISGYPGSEQVNSSFELTSQSYNIDGVEFPGRS